MFPKSQSKLFLSILILSCSILSTTGRISINHNKDTRRLSTCKSEINTINDAISNWSTSLNQMIKDTSAKDDNIYSEEEQIQKLIQRFKSNVNKQPIEQVVKDLVFIRRRSNKLALEIYLKTFDIRWPQSSVQLSGSVERVQQACLPNLDRAAMMVLSPPFALNTKPEG